MKAYDFINAFKEGMRLYDGDLEIFDGYFAKRAVFNVPVNCIEMAIESSDIVHLGSRHGDVEIWYLNICTDGWRADA